jgi:hypothetical protein
MGNQTKRVGPLLTAGAVAVENARVYKEFRNGKLEPSVASRLSTILMNQRVILEASDVEGRISEMEAQLLQSVAPKLLTGRRVD